MARRRRRSRKLRPKELANLIIVVIVCAGVAPLLPYVVPIVVGVLSLVVAVFVFSLVTAVSKEFSKGSGKQQRKQYSPLPARTRSDWHERSRAAGRPNLDSAIDAIVHPRKLWRRSEVLASRCPVPKAPGLYGWYFRTPPHPRISLDRCVYHDGCYLLYVGISGNLRSRIRFHYRTWSTLRMTLGSLLADELGLKPTDKDLHWDNEDKLSHWMLSNAFVVWVEHPAPRDIEPEIICRLDLPLNLDDNEDNRFYATLKAARKRQRQRLRDLAP